MSQSQPEVRVRFAPSPSGNLHIGGARTALFNWAFARKHGGKFVLRVEDTDSARSSREAEQSILDALSWLGMDWDEGPDEPGEFGPYRQSERQEQHLGVAAALYQAGWAYRCFCTSERLTALREEQLAAKQRVMYDGCCRELPREEAEARMQAGEQPVLRFAVPEGETRFTDLVRGEVTFQNAEVDDFVMVRGDGSPTYNFVVVCDDVAMRISHVARGDDHLTNTPKQVLLYRALGEPLPIFAHFPLMLGKDKKKLSKRTGDTDMKDYRDRGYPPKAVLNFLALQGWALDGERDLFSVEELIERFELGDVSKAGAVFDPDKFRWMASEYLRAESSEELVANVGPYMLAAGLMSEAELSERSDWLLGVVLAHKERIELYSDLPEAAGWLFGPDQGLEWDPKAEKGARKHAGAAETLADYREFLLAQLAGGASASDLRDCTKAWVDERGLKIPGLFQPLRCALSGRAGGPDLFEMIELLGPERSSQRLADAEQRLRD